MLMPKTVSVSPVVPLLTAISDPLRLRLCYWLEQEELSVGEVARVFELPQSTISRHLKALIEAGWLQRRQEGTSTFYRLTQDDLSDAARSLWRAVREQVDEQETQLRADRQRLQTVLAARSADSLAYFGRVAESWDGIRTQLFGHDFTASALLTLLPSHWRVVDLGCGTGGVASLLAPHVASVTGVDASATMLAAARQRIGKRENVQFIDAAADATPLRSGGAELVTSVLLLHHLDEPLAVVREAARLLTPRGKLLVVDMVPHERTIFRATMGHKHLGFSEAAVRRMFREGGFDPPTIRLLPRSAGAKGPALFAALATKST
jgi:ubiquinone/menaquinone biosynthesis C-methylase UbiE/DNA-binding transcriptional ArsR family regulator